MTGASWGTLMTRHSTTGLISLFGSLALSSCIITRSASKPCAGTSCSVPPVAAASTASEQSPPKSGEPRIEHLLSLLTLDEKMSLVSGTGFDTVGVPRLAIPGLHMTDGPLGVRVGNATRFAAGIALAATFDPQLVEQVGQALGREVLAHDKNVLLGPCVNIHRTPHGGRNFESFGEDPYLAARTAVAYIRGVQSEHVIATVKHFAANNQETDRNTIDVSVDERALNEIYLPAFEASVKQGAVMAVMCSYNRLNGPYTCESPYLLQNRLSQWGFKGLVMSDWDATHSVVPAITAGLHLEMPTGKHFSKEHLQQALQSKTITLAHLDEMVRRQLSVISAMGWLDQPMPHGETDTTAHRALNRQLARSSFVLLKNDTSLLPLDRNRLKRLAVIGPRVAHVDAGGGSAHVTATYEVSLLKALQEHLGDKILIDYAPGAVAPESLQLVPSSALRTPKGEPAMSGLRGDYFDNERFDGTPKFTRIDPSIDFSWGLASPDSALPADHYSITWRGQLIAPATGRYLIALRSDDGSRLTLNGKRVIDNWGGHPPTLKSAEVELVAGVPNDLRIDYFDGILGASVSLLWTKIDESLANKARSAARAADVALVLVGDSEGDETEGMDRERLLLPGSQNELIKQTIAVNPRTVVVVGTGAPILMVPWLDKTPSILQAWFSGQESGHALVDVLFGEVSPSGKLPMTFAKRDADNSDYGNFPGADGGVVYAENLLVGYRHFDTHHIVPEFPFGHGLSYTQFAYRNLVVERPTPEGRVSVHLLVKNTGKRHGAEVVQLYVHHEESELPRPEQELKAFQKLNLGPGEEQAAKFDLDARSFSYFDPRTHDWRLEPGRFEIRVGSSSRDIRTRASVNLP